jgi:hypothetical protein
MMGAMSLNRSLIWPECHDSKIGTQMTPITLIFAVTILLLIGDYQKNQRYQRAILCFL